MPWTFAAAAFSANLDAISSAESLLQDPFALDGLVASRSHAPAALGDVAPVAHAPGSDGPGTGDSGGSSTPSPLSIQQNGFFLDSNSPGQPTILLPPDGAANSPPGSGGAIPLSPTSNQISPLGPTPEIQNPHVHPTSPQPTVPGGSPPAAPPGDGPLKNTGPRPVDTLPDFNDCCACASCGGADSSSGGSNGGGATKELIQDASGYSQENAPGRFSQGHVRYFDGVLELMTTDLTSSGFGVQWGFTRSWTNGAGYAATSFYGTGEVVSQLPYLQSFNLGGTIAVITNGVNAREFDASGGTWVPHFYIQDQLTYSSSAKQYTLTDTTGNQITFSDFSTSYPANQQGQFVSFTDPDGNTTSVTSRTGDGKPAKSSAASPSAARRPPSHTFTLTSLPA